MHNRIGSNGLVCSASRISLGAIGTFSAVGPGDLRRQGNDTLAERDEQASRDEVGGGAGVAAVAVGAEPGVEVGDGDAASVGVWPAGGEDGGGPLTGRGGQLLAA